MNRYVRVCSLADIVENEIVTISIPELRTPVLLIAVNDKIFAGNSMCPHEDVSLASGRIENGNIVCPGHGYTFDLSTGRCSHTPKLRWQRFNTKIQDHDIYIELFSADTTTPISGNRTVT